MTMRKTAHNPGRYVRGWSCCGNLNQSAQAIIRALPPLHLIPIFRLPRQPSLIDASPLPEVEHPAIIFRLFASGIGRI